MLLVDLGNTRIKWTDPAALAAGRFQGAVHGGLIDGTRIDSWWGTRPAPDRVVVANVAGDAAAEAIRAWTVRHWGVRPEFATVAPTACGVVNGYRDPERLGVDRWAALVGARDLAAGAVCVVDCGTAITADLLDAGGGHLGGAIVPGIALMGRALRGAAPAIPDMPPADAVRWEPAAGPGRDTEEGIAAGSLLGVAGFIERFHRLAVERLGEPPGCLLCGGDAARVAPLVGPDCRCVPELVLVGLARLAGEKTREPL